MRTSPVLLGVLVLLGLAPAAWGNGGPFVLQYPAGDNSARGASARLDVNLQPGREERLRVLKEDLSFSFFPHEPYQGRFGDYSSSAPLVEVTAAYVVENPTTQAITEDFGFPVLRGEAYQRGLEPQLGAQVSYQGKMVDTGDLSLPDIYGAIRQQARAVVDKAIAASPELTGRVAAVRGAKATERETARTRLADYLTGTLKWNARDAALLVEYAGLDMTLPKEIADNYKPQVLPPSVAPGAPRSTIIPIDMQNLGPLIAIGDQKATQLFAQLAKALNPKAAVSYESLFTAWGGDVRDRALDMKTGDTRPRENSVKNPYDDLATVYARVDYLDEKNPALTAQTRAACKTILKNLPVVFTFAPMNLLTYRITFPAKSTGLLKVTYSQFAFIDTKAPSSYQLAYVVHPASFWKEFGPINVGVAVPSGIACRLPIPSEKPVTEPRKLRYGVPHLAANSAIPYDIQRAVLKEKTGVLYLAVDRATWDGRYNAEAK